MRIGIDVHGVIDTDPERFKRMMKGFRKPLTHFENMKLELPPSNKVIVVSGPPADQICQELNDLGLRKDEHFDEVVSVVDFLKERNAKMWLDEKGTWWTDDRTWWSSKGRICKAKGIDVLIDDQIRYRPTCKKHGVVFIQYSKEKIQWL